VARRRLGFWKRGAAALVKPLMIVMSRRDWRGMKNIPANHQQRSFKKPSTICCRR